MTSQSSSHAERASSVSSSPKVQVQRSISRETITIHFSAFGKEEEEEEEEFKDSSMILHEDRSFVPGLEEKESTCEHGGQLLLEPATSSNMSPASTSVTVSMSSSALTITSSEPLETSAMVPSASLTTSATALPLFSMPAQLLVSTTLPSDVRTTISASTFDSAPKFVVQSVVPSPSLTSAKPFTSLVKSLSTEVEPKEPTTPLRTRQLMKTLVKSLSTDTSKQESESVPFRTSDSRINLHLFKQFTQPRVTSGDSKTAPSSPVTSPSEGRSFFKVTEVEARIEDTKRRLSEVIYEPFQLLNKIIGDETSSLRHKALSSSATELTTLASLNGHLESNNNYSIKEEEYDSDGDYSTKDSIPNTNSSKPMNESSKDGDTKNSQGTTREISLKTSSLGLEKCSLSVLASKEDDEYCDLYLEEFELETDEEIVVDKALEPLTGEEAVENESKLLRQHETESEAQQLEVPFKTLLLCAILVYSYLVLPLPSYLSGLLLGIGCGFMIAIGVIWLVVPRKSRGYEQSQRRLHLEHLTTEPLDIKEPEIYKVGKYLSLEFGLHLNIVPLGYTTLAGLAI
ncbi:testis-expressed protein 2-like [Rhincodon typus]|uniref:testis-expressed protein 2-like n=1 Tax=Rhincodon typus TaxID=259920 RepID=UPI0020300AEA|nr:testis-expressed protein 2-like [Rhincodon typus]